MPLLLTGYALAAVAATALWPVAGGLAAALMVWIGGAVLTFGLAAFPLTQRLFSRNPGAAAAEAAAALSPGGALDADRQADVIPPQASGARRRSA